MKIQDILNEAAGDIDIDFTEPAIRSGIAKLVTDSDLTGRKIVLYLVPVAATANSRVKLAKIKLAFRGRGTPFDIMIGVVAQDGRFNFTKNDLVAIYKQNQPVLNAQQQQLVKTYVAKILQPALK